MLRQIDLRRRRHCICTDESFACTVSTMIPIPQRVLLGPGPSDVPPRVLEALGRADHRPSRSGFPPADGRHPHRSCSRSSARSNEMTLAVSGTGSAGMETLFVNLIEPGDKVLVGVNGVFGGRMADVAGRCGAIVETIEAPWGQVFDQDAGHRGDRPREAEGRRARARRDLDRRASARRQARRRRPTSAGRCFCSTA